MAKLREFEASLGNIMRLTQRKREKEKKKRKEKRMVIEQPCQAATTKTLSFGLDHRFRNSHQHFSVDGGKNRTMESEQVKGVR